jgi:hypothetical protein
VNTRTEDLLKGFSEWLDQEGLIVPDSGGPLPDSVPRKGPGEDKRSHEDLVREFLHFEAGRLEGTADGSAELDYRAELEEKVDKQRELLDGAWGLIANAGGGDWSKETGHWQRVAAAWRDKAFGTLPAVVNSEQSPEDAAREMAKELGRLQVGMQELGFSLRPGPVRGAEVDTALNILREQAQHHEDLRENVKQAHVELGEALNRISRADAQTAFFKDRLVSETAALRAKYQEALAVLKGVWPAVTERELAKVLYGALEAEKAFQGAWVDLVAEDKAMWQRVAQRVHDRIAGSTDQEAVEYEKLAAKYAAAQHDLDLIEEWLTMNVPGIERGNMSTAELTLFVFHTTRQFAQMGLGVFRSMWPALQTFAGAIGLVWKDGTWQHVTDWEPASDPTSPSQG